MAFIIFENATPDQAAGFTTADTLVFSSATTTALNVTVTPGSGLNSGTTLTAGGKSLSFPAAALATASQAGQVVFNDNTRLALGTASGETITLNSTADTVVYGLGGDDVITGFADTMSGVNGDADDYFFGGAGADTLNGADGNDHLYGNALGVAQGAADGADVINGGYGADYIQGNAGDDVLDGGFQSDRIFGGNGADVITGGGQADTINGNLGNDNINGGSGNDVLRGGQGNDIIVGGSDSASVAAATGNDSIAAETGGNDILFGDLGNDTLTGGNGDDVLFGGGGNDVFFFATGDAGTVTGTSATDAIIDVIGDFEDGVDKINLNATGNGATGYNVITDTTGTTFGTVLAAQNYAQTLLLPGAAGGSAAASATAVDVVALQFGGDTYLFAAAGSAAGTTIDTAIKVVGVVPSAFTSTDFAG